MTAVVRVIPGTNFEFKIKYVHYISHSISALQFLGYLATFMYITSNSQMMQKETDWPILSFSVIFLRQTKKNHVAGYEV